MDTLSTFLSEQMIERIGWVLVHFLWQGIAVAALLWCMLKALHKASSNTRYVAACAGLALMVAAPVATFIVTVPDAPIAVAEMPAPPVSPAPAPAPAETRTIVVAPVEPAPLPELSLVETLMARLEAALPYCVIGWAVGVAVLSVWYLGGWCQLQKLRRIGTKAVSDVVEANASLLAQRLDIRRAVHIAESALVQVPTVIGWLKPIVLLPATALTGLDEVQLTAMIAHELAHIKRCDYLINIAQTIVEILGFYHPALWWASRQIRTERENACDDMAVALVQNRKQYAGALFTMEAVRSKQLDLAVAANGGHLTNRITRLAGKPANHPKSGWIPSVVAVLLIAAFMIPAAMALRQEPEVSSQKAKEKNAAAQSMTYLKQLGLAWVLFVEDNNDDDVPSDWEELKPYLEDETVYSWLIENAVLLETERPVDNPGRTPVGYDKTFLEKYGRRIIVFADGHVEIDKNDGLKDLLDDAIGVADRVDKMSKLKDVGLALHVWAGEHENVFPVGILQVEFEDEALKEWALKNVKYLAAGKAFLEIEDFGKEVIAYDKNLSKIDDGTNLLFADGHVEFREKDENGIVVLYPGGRKQPWATVIRFPTPI